MRKFVTLLSFAAGILTVAAQYTTPGGNKAYTFKTLSEIEESGVTASGSNSYIVNEAFTVAESDTLTLCNGDRVYMANEVTITVNGYCKFTPTTIATLLPVSEEAIPLGIMIKGDNAVGEFKNVVFNVVALRTTAKSPLIVENCSFIHSNNKFASGATVMLSTANSGNIIRGCRFIDNKTSAVSGAANYATGIIFENNYLENCVTENTNRPYINLTVGGEDSVIVRNNVVVGNKLSKVGGIAVANLLSMSGANKVLVEGNDVRDCRYGFTATGMMDVKILNNNFVNNKYETNAMNGGSGISLYAVAGAPQYAYASGNYICGNLWGVTNIMNVTANFGRAADKDSEDYNPGGNVFSNNGNNGVLYDFYNNSANTAYAQFNTWGVEAQTAEEIEKVIFHKNDKADLGEVIFMPSGPQSSVNSLVAENDGSNIIAYHGDEITLACEADIVVYSTEGKVAAQTAGARSKLSTSNLPCGVYIVKAAVDGNVYTTKIAKR